MPASLGQKAKAASFPVTLASDSDTLPVDIQNQISGTVIINDDGNSITVDAPVATPVFVRLSDGAAAITTLPVSAASLPLPAGAATEAELDSQTALLTTIDADTSRIPALGQATMANSAPVVVASNQSAIPVSGTVAVTGVATEATLATIDADTGSILTAVQLLDDTVAVLGTDVYTEAATKGTTIGAVRRDADTTLVGTTNEIGPLQMNALGQLKVEAFSGETLPVSLASTTVTGTVAVTQSGTWDEVGINDSGNSITVDGTVTVGTMAALVAGTANIGDVDVLTLPALVAGTANIGDVDVLTLPALPAGTNNIGDVDVLTLPGVAGDIAHDGVDSGNPVKIGGKAAVAVPTAVAAADRVNAWFDLNGRQVIQEISDTATLSNVAGSASSVTVLASNTARKGAVVVNDSAAVCYLKFGSTASATSFTYKMAPDDTLEVPFGYTGILTGLWTSAVGSARVTEVT